MFEKAKQHDLQPNLKTIINGHQRRIYIETNQNNARNENDHSFIQCSPYGVTWNRANVYSEMIFQVSHLLHVH